MSEDEKMPADSNGVPWEGREFHENPFAGDSGETPTDVAVALATFRQGDSDLASLLDVINTSRALIPLFTNPGEDFDPAHPVMEDKVQELAVVTVAGPNGEKALPAFTSVEAMKSWSADARPIPIDMRRVALAAVSDNADRVVINPGTDHLVLRRPMVWAMAKGERYVPPTESVELFEHLTDVLTAIDPIDHIELYLADPLSYGDGPELGVVAFLPPGLDEAALTVILENIQRVTSGDEVLLSAAESILVRFAATQ